MAAFPRCCPTESPDRQRSGLTATEEWRPGRRRAIRLPRRSGRLNVRDGAVCGIRTECARRVHLSRRTLWVSTNLRAGELSEALPPNHLFGGYGPASWELADPFSVKPVLHDNPCQVGRKSPRWRVRSDFSGPEARGDCRNSSIADCTPAFGLFCPLRHPVPTGMQLNGGVHRRTGDVLVDRFCFKRKGGDTGTDQLFRKVSRSCRLAPSREPELFQVSPTAGANLHGKVLAECPLRKRLGANQRNERIQW